MAAAAEQDNRVRFPNGTAAVNAEAMRRVKTGHWKQFREGRAFVAKRLQPLFLSMSQKTYGLGFSVLLRGYKRMRLSQKNGCGTCFGCRSNFIFRR